LDMVERVCGIPKGKFEEVTRLFCGTSGPDKTGTVTYALNLTQHTNGVENIRALCMLQLLPANIGRPGGAVVALRGHANVQGATDLELLYHELPGYMAVPLRDAHPDLKTYLEKETPKGGYWTNKPKFFVSLLKAFYGDAATKDNEFGYQWIAKRASADATRWVIEIEDNNDSNGNGVPDLSDALAPVSVELKIVRAGKDISLTWPIAAKGYVLEATEGLK